MSKIYNDWKKKKEEEKNIKMNGDPMIGNQKQDNPNALVTPPLCQPPFSWLQFS